MILDYEWFVCVGVGESAHIRSVSMYVCGWSEYMLKYVYICVYARWSMCMWYVHAGLYLLYVMCDDGICF